ncbi:predicted protein [Francisella philomiragia subsp. philomiragia ATCC 25015]|nr:predicted protein [Francisella philomiragia subsp. philomiragia ATCC 25015]
MSMNVSIYRKISWRILPFLIVCFTLAYIDRVNVSFAKIQMMSELGFSETVYGLGAGIFFIGYFIFEVPSNYLLVKVGASRWLGFLMVVWGALSSLTMFIDSAQQFYLLRFLLGLAEAGFVPGVIYYLSEWYPSYRRAKVTAIFLSSIALSGIVGGPISGFIMNIFDQYYYGGWRMLFLIEGIPTIILGFMAPSLLSSIDKAKWINQAEREYLHKQLENDCANQESPKKLAVFMDIRVWWLSAIYFCGITGLYTVCFYLPALINNVGIKNIFAIGVISAIPYISAIVAMIAISASSDYFKERKYHFIVVNIIAVIGFLGIAVFDNNIYFALIFMSLATAGILTLVSLFWSLPATLMSGMAAAIAIAIINSVGNLSGFVTPYLIGYIIDTTKSISPALYIISVVVLFGSVLLYRFSKKVDNI